MNADESAQDGVTVAVYFSNQGGSLLHGSHGEGRVTRLRIKLAAASESVPQARRAVAEFCAQAGFPRELVDAASVAVTEASANCVLHAYRESEAGAFTVDARVDNDALVIAVTDEGSGIRALPGSCAARQPADGQGLGFRLIAGTATGVEVSSSAIGTRVLMRFVPRAPSRVHGDRHSLPDRDA